MKRKNRDSLRVISNTMVNVIDTTKVAAAVEEEVVNKSQALLMSRRIPVATINSSMMKGNRKKAADAKELQSSKLHPLRMLSISLREERHLPNRLDKLYK